MLLQTTANTIFQRIGKRLHEIRIRRNEKLTAVAHEVGISHGVISQIENGRYHSLSVKTLHSLASYYRTSLDDIMREE